MKKYIHKITNNFNKVKLDEAKRKLNLGKVKHTVIHSTKKINLKEFNISRFKAKHKLAASTGSKNLNQQERNNKSGITRASLFSRVWRVVFVLILLYVIGGLIVANQIYRKNGHSNSIDKALALYPLPAARVNKQFIPVTKIYSQINYVEQFSKQSCQKNSSSCQKIDSFSTIRDRALDQQIENTIIAQAASKLNVKVTQKNIDKAYKKISDENGGSKKVNEVLQTLYGMNPAEFKVLLANQLLRDKINNDAIQHVDVSHILVADEEKAKTVISDIKNKKIIFSDAAKQYSKDDNSKDKGGSLGSIGREVMPKEFDDVAFDKAKVGQVYDQPVKTEFGYHIILVNKKTGTIKENFNDWLVKIKKDSKVVKFLK